ncbi:MAG: hypothetical protein ACREFY_15915 [Acetobacteraceae bacterium]
MLPRARKTRALLAVLAIHAPQPILRTQLIALLWSRREPEQARGSLRQALHELQLMLGRIPASLLCASRHELALSDRGLWTDVGTLARAGPRQAMALDLYRPLLLADLAGVDPALDAWIASEARRLDRLAHALARATLAAAMHPGAMVAAAEHLVQRDPDDAAAWDALIGVLTQSGDFAGATAAEARRLVAREAHGPAGTSSMASLSPAGGTPATAAATSATAQGLMHNPAGLVPPPGSPSTGLALAGTAEAPMPVLVAPPFDRPSLRAGSLVVPRFGATRTTWAGAAPPRGLRVGVIGLRALSGTTDAAHQAAALAAGLSEELVAVLARFRGISCVPIGVLSGGAVAESWRRADLDFLLDGMVQCSGEMVRISIRLLDFAAAGEVIWSTRFDRPLDNLFTLQDEIAGETVARLESRLLLWEEGRRRGAGDPAARRLLREALPGLLRLNRQAFERAGVLLDASRRLDPENAAVHAWLAHWHLFAVGQGWAEDPSGAAQQVRALADAAVALDPGDARGFALAAHVRGFVDRDATAAEPLHARAADANPNLPLGWSLSGLNEAYLGRYEEAIRRAGLARRLSPQDPLRYFFDMALAVPHFLRGDDAAAIRFGYEAIAASPGFSSAYKTQLAALGQLGRHAEAAEIRARLLALEPGFSLGQALERSPILDAAGRARYAEGLRLGGLD